MSHGTCEEQRGAMGQTLMFGVKWCHESRGEMSTESPPGTTRSCSTWHVVQESKGTILPRTLALDDVLEVTMAALAPVSPYNALTPSAHASEPHVHWHPCTQASTCTRTRTSQHMFSHKPMWKQEPVLTSVHVAFLLDHKSPSQGWTPLLEM